MIPLLIFLIGLSSDAGALFLTISPGARQVAMGSAFTGVADDITAMYYNPAGLAFQSNTTVGIMNPLCYFGLGPEACGDVGPGMEHIYIGGVTPVPIGTGTFGIGYSYLGAVEDIITYEDGCEIVWPYYDYALIVSYAERVTKNLGIGVSLKYIYSVLPPWEIFFNVIPGEEAQTIAWDWGIFYRTSIPGLSGGISYQNLGSEGLRYSESGKLKVIPSLARAGAGLNIVELCGKRSFGSVSLLNFSVDVTRSLVAEDHDNWYGGGVEIGLMKTVFVRTGYFSSGEGRREGITYGCGINAYGFQIDVADDADIYGSLDFHWRLQLNLNPLETIKRIQGRDDQ
jgi:hypothetical protein